MVRDAGDNAYWTEIGSAWRQDGYVSIQLDVVRWAARSFSRSRVSRHNSTGVGFGSPPQLEGIKP